MRADHRRRTTIIVAAGVLGAMVVAISLAASHGLSGKSVPATRTAQGAVTLVRKTYFTSDSATSCHGIGNYVDLVGGGAVVIKSFTGETLATTQLAPGKIDDNGFCEFAFSASVRTGRGPYEIDVTRRQPTQVTEADLFSRVNLSLGA